MATGFLKMAEQQHYTEVLEESTMRAQDYERGRFAIRDFVRGLSFHWSGV